MIGKHTHRQTHTHISPDSLQGEGINYTFTTNLPPKCACTTLTCRSGAINNKNFITCHQQRKAVQLEGLNYECYTKQASL